MDSTEFNKIAGAALGALLIFLLLNFFSGQIYGTREGAEHGGEEVLAFALAVETEGAGEAAEEPQVDYATLVAAADPAAGESVFRACSACHKVEEGANAVGPYLWGVVGRDIASLEGFGYSDALAAAEGDWTLEHLSGFLEDPKAWAPGTKMSFAGLDDPQDRVNVIAYLNEADGSPVDLAAGLEPVAAAGDAGAAADTGAAEGQAAGLPGQAGEGTPAPGASAGEATTGTAAAVEDSAQPVPGAEPGAAETSVSEGDDAGGTVTGATIVDNTDEGADVPSSPAAETHEGEQPGEDILDTGDPSPEAAAQQAPGIVGAPGEGAAPVAGSPDAADAEEDAATPGRAAPSERVEGEDAPPQEAPGQAPERQGAATDVQTVAPGQEAGQEPGQEPREAEQALAAGSGDSAGQQAAETPPAAEGQEQALAQAPAPAAPAGAAAGAGAFAGGDAAAGEKLFRRCAACHKVEEGKQGIGPSLWGVVGRDVAAVEGYSYSDAMQAHEGDWTAQHLSDYLENPKAVVPGTKMAFAGLRDEQDRIDVITYLNEADGSPEPLQ